MSITKEGYTTVADNQTVIAFPIMEGEREMASNNNQLSKLSLNLPFKAPKGTHFFNVTFELDINGILNVSAIGTNLDQKGTVTVNNYKGRLTD